jgi:hypothetical protein
VPRAARGRFKTQRTAARKQIKHPPAIERLTKPIKEGFADPIGRRAQANHGRNGD